MQFSSSGLRLCCCSLKMLADSSLKNQAIAEVFLCRTDITTVWQRKSIGKILKSFCKIVKLFKMQKLESLQNQLHFSFNIIAQLKHDGYCLSIQGVPFQHGKSLVNSALQSGSSCYSRFQFQHSAAFAEVLFIQLIFTDWPISVGFAGNFRRK